MNIHSMYFFMHFYIIIYTVIHTYFTIVTNNCFKRSWKIKCMALDIINKLEDFRNWKRTNENYEIHVYMPRIGTKVHNKLENTRYITNEERKICTKQYNG